MVAAAVSSASHQFTSDVAAVDGQSSVCLFPQLLWLGPFGVQHGVLAIDSAADLDRSTDVKAERVTSTKAIETSDVPWTRTCLTIIVICPQTQLSIFLFQNHVFDFWAFYSYRKSADSGNYILAGPVMKKLLKAYNLEKVAKGMITSVTKMCHILIKANCKTLEYWLNIKKAYDMYGLSEQNANQALNNFTQRLSIEKLPTYSAYNITPQKWLWWCERRATLINSFAANFAVAKGIPVWRLRAAKLEDSVTVRQRVRLRFSIDHRKRVGICDILGSVAHNVERAAQINMGVPWVTKPLF
ncbi:hypothetical protein CEXT_334921 [Caerostris extrusa]|uniref:Uncharacterized protein n=1 Tax=Caerostris extrusa TaxID=172846 RepID=A0AAV4TRN5_CAEEX|nr:hypothetical protein CEXT_334921 [Caerostris extrusa]